MDTMDYGYFAGAGNQQYQFGNYNLDAGLLAGGAPTDTTLSTPSLEHPLDANAFLSGTFDYAAFDGTVHHTPLTSAAASASPRNDSMDSGLGMDMDADAQYRRGSSEEKDSMTPAQSRRKAQNRAAQRAFRERKERHVRDLEAKLNLLTTTTSSLQSDNERLKMMLQRAQTENEILRATASSSPSASHPPSFVDDPSLFPQQTKRSSVSTDDSHYDATRLAQGLFSAESSAGNSTKFSSPSATSSEGSHMLSASATWDLLQSHPLYLCGSIDIGEVCERLKKMARCEGSGPMFDEEEVRRVIEEVGRGGGDELI